VGAGIGPPRSGVMGALLDNNKTAVYLVLVDRLFPRAYEQVHGHAASWGYWEIRAPVSVAVDDVFSGMQEATGFALQHAQGR